MMHCSVPKDRGKLSSALALYLPSNCPIMGVVQSLELRRRFDIFFMLDLGQWTFELERSTLDIHPLYFSRSDARPAFRAISFFPERAALSTTPSDWYI